MRMEGALCRKVEVGLCLLLLLVLIVHNGNDEAVQTLTGTTNALIAF